MKRVLPKKLQILNLQKELKKRGIEPDTVDLEALVDPTLSYHENLRNVLMHVGKATRTMTEEEAEAKRRDFLEQVAEKIHEERSEHAQRVDERKGARNVLELSEENIEKWQEHPERYDIAGVDYPIEGLVARYGELELTGEHGVVAVMGMRGSGKTYLLKNIYTSTDRILWIDPVGVMDQAPRLKVDVLPDSDTFRDIFCKALKKSELIVDISELNRDEMVTAVDWISEILLNCSGKKTTTIVLDEIGEYAEQERRHYAQSLERLVRIGRNKGVLWVVMATQRPQKVNKHILALSDYYIIFRLLHNRDLEAVKELLGLDTKEWKAVASKIKKQKTGEYMVYDGIKYVWIRGGKNA